MTNSDSKPIAMGERLCSECSKSFDPGRSRTARCWPCVDMKRNRNTSGFGGRRTRLTDTIKDIAYAINELTQAHAELRAVAAIANPSQRDAALIEPASRIGLACAFLDEVELRMGWERPVRCDPYDSICDSSKRPGRNSNASSVQGEPDCSGEGSDVCREDARAS